MGYMYDSAIFNVSIFRYRLSLIKRVNKALHLAQKVSIRTDTRGILSMQFMIEQPDNQHIFIEFFVRLFCFVPRDTVAISVRTGH